MGEFFASDIRPASAAALVANVMPAMPSSSMPICADTVNFIEYWEMGEDKGPALQLGDATCGCGR